MSRALLWMGLIVLIGQAPVEPPELPEAETVRVLAIQVREVTGGTRHVDPSLEPMQELLAKVPGNHFSELGFHEVEAPYGQDARVELGEGYSFTIRPTELTEDSEIVFECIIDLTERDSTVEALRVQGKAIRGEGAAFRGLALKEGEMMVIMSIAKAEEDSRGGGRGESGQDSEGAGDGGTGESGQDGAGDGFQREERDPSPLVPVLESRAPEPDPPAPPEGAVAVAGENAPAPADRATIEGILRALEEQDMAEQKNARSRRYDVVFKGDWW